MATTCPRAAAILAIGATLAAAGCVGTGEPVLTFSGSVVGREADVIRRQLERFGQAHPSITVALRATPDASDQRHQLYVQWLNARRSDPDVLQLDVVWTPEFAAAGWIASLDRFDPPIDRFFPAAVAADRWNGALYALPWQEEAMTLGTRVAVMRDGIVEQVAPALEVFRRPANMFVAGFVGSPGMNLWSCTCRRVGDGVRVVSPAVSIELEGVDFAVPDGGNVWAGVRPHDIDLVADGEGDGVGRVDVVEPLGPVTLIHLRVEGLPHQLVRVAVAGDTGIEIGARVSFSVRRDRVHVFDGEGMRRLN